MTTTKKAAPRKQAALPEQTEPRRTRGRPSNAERGLAAPETAAQRRARSDAEKIARGEVRVNTWISPDAAKGLNEMTKGNNTRGAVQGALNYLFTEYWKDVKKRGGNG